MSFSTSSLTPDQHKTQAAHKAVEYIQDGQILGLGTGSTVHHFLTALGKRVQHGLRVRGVPTSQATATYATQLGIPLLDNDEPWDIDIAVDGADQVDPQLNLIKGGWWSIAPGKNCGSGSPPIYCDCGPSQAAPAFGLAVSFARGNSILWMANHPTASGEDGLAGTSARTSRATLCDRQRALHY